MTPPIYPANVLTKLAGLRRDVEMLKRRAAGAAPSPAGAGVHYPAPGQLVLPGRRYWGSGRYKVKQPVTVFPGGVVAVALNQNPAVTLGPAANIVGGTSVSSDRGIAPANNPIYADQIQPDFATADTLFSLKPVDDLGLDPDQQWAIWFCYRTSGVTPGDWRIQSVSSRSGGPYDLTATWPGYMNNDPTNPMDWLGDPAHTSDYLGNAPDSSYYYMKPIGGDRQAGDFSPAATFAAGETLTVKAYSMNDGGNIYLDHLVFFPHASAGWSGDSGIDHVFDYPQVNVAAAFFEGVLGYYIGLGNSGWPGGNPPGIFEDTNDRGGAWDNDTVEDRQVLNGPLDPAARLTIAQYDEGEALSHSSVQAVAVYAQVRGHRDDDTYQGRWANNGHVTAFADGVPMGGGYVADGGGWAWIYLGDRQAMTESDMENATQIMLWRNDETTFNYADPQTAGKFDSVRIGWVMLVPLNIGVERVPTIKYDGLQDTP